MAAEKREADERDHFGKARQTERKRIVRQPVELVAEGDFLYEEGDRKEEGGADKAPVCLEAERGIRIARLFR